MGLRYRKTIKLFKGLNLNLSKSGVGLSFGIPGLRQSVNTSGKAVTTIGLPGTGLSYVKQTNVKKLGSKLKGMIGGKGEQEEEAVSPAKPASKRSKKAVAVAASAAAISADEQPAAPAVQEETAPMFVPVHSPLSSQPFTPLEENITLTPEILRTIHRVADDPVPWEEISKNPRPTSDFYSPIIWSYLHSQADKILAGDIDAYLQVIGDVNPLDDLLPFGSSFEFGTDSPKMIDVEFQVREGDVMPKNLSKVAYYDLLLDYVSSITLRVARDMLSLLPVDKVVVQAVEGENTLLSCVFDREKMAAIPFSSADPSSVITRFEHQMNFSPLKGFLPIEQG
ncbi:MAG: DUF4236 domain-containing protein [Eubacteriales bacterium]|nr:DUF4236 domain-containing protein [Eubacteriales bacterium]MDD3881950.1 DUF4236 domain-containing protein [Eubacteriales bacterium]MDD4513149.1 DUF4236 domain-containing protein [Eubacteriales bacterium]